MNALQIAGIILLSPLALIAIAAVPFLFYGYIKDMIRFYKEKNRQMFLLNLFGFMLWTGSLLFITGMIIETRETYLETQAIIREMEHN